MYPRPAKQIAEASAVGDLSAIFDAIDEAIVHIDEDWRVLYANDVYLRFSRLNASQIIGRTPFEFAPEFKKTIFYEPILRCQEERKETRQISYSPFLSIWVRVRVVPYLRGSVLMISKASEDSVKDHLRAERAEKDALTGLGNRLAMEDRTRSLLRRRAPFTLVLLGINDLKTVSDAHGYAAADMAVLQIASRVSTVLLEGEAVFRVNTDEFAFLMFGGDIEIGERAKGLIDTVRRAINLPTARILLTASIGVVDAAFDNPDFEHILKRSSLALADARKNSSRKGNEYSAICFYRADLELASQMRTELKEELRLALDGHQFMLHLQPKISLASGRVVGAEALIRWDHPRRGLLSPGIFLEIAQDIGAMSTIDNWVLNASALLAKRLEAIGKSMPISLNLSAESMSDRLLPKRCESILRDFNIQANQLEIEIPEGALITDVALSTHILSELNSMGIRLSIDDFGTGYSSFSYLAQFPVHTLKVDRSFVNELQSSKPNRTIVQSIIKLAHHLSLDVVAEGAECEEQVAILKRMNCDNVQGYVFARPMPLEDFLRFCTERVEAVLPDPMRV